MPDFDGSVRIGVEMDTGRAEKEVKDLSGELDNAVGGAGKLADKLKSALAAAARIGVGAAAAATSGVVALTNAAVSAYGEYEQLVGGVDTLFKDSADTVMEYAENAYKTAGLSANEYMETVTSFSASLLQSLDGDTEQAAQMADMAITDMSDNANKLGTDMEAIQNAYNGFAKQNFTMLDNLKLGYGGTKEEMERLLADAEKLSGIKYDVSSYADIVSAIHVVQTEMGITGTTALEASTTIQGSIGSMKSAWENLVTGLADENADLDTLINNFLESVLTVGENIVPVVEESLSSAGQLIADLAPKIGAELPNLIVQVLPSLLDAGIQLIQGVVEGVMSALPELQAAAGNAFDSLIVYLKENLPQMISTGLEALLSFSEGFRENVGVLVDNAIELIMTLADGIIEALPDLIATVPEIISNFANAINDNAPKLLKSAAELIAKLVKGLIDNIPVIIQNIPKIIAAIVDTITAFNWLNLGKKIIEFFAQGIKNMLSSVVNVAKNIVKSITDGGGLKNLPQMALQWGKDLIDNFVNGIKNMIGKVKDAVSNVASTVKSFLGFSEPDKGPLSNFHTFAPDMVQLFAKGISDTKGLAVNAARDMANAVSNAMAVPSIQFEAPHATIPSISTYNVPALARGTVIPTSPQFTAAMSRVGTAGGIEARLASIEQVLGSVMGRAEAGSGQPIQVNVMLDKRVLARAMVNEVNDMTRQAGKPVLLI